MNLRRTMSRSLALLLTFGGYFSGALHAAGPAWWTEPQTRILSETASPDPFAPVTLGQLKFVAAQAKKHLDVALASVGGAGPEIHMIVDAFEPRGNVSYTPEERARISEYNFSPCNLGQIKAIAKPFYDRLSAVGYDSRANLIARGYPQTWDYTFPWNPDTAQEENYVPGNLGQLKMIFSFSLTGFDTSHTDADEDGLRDEWEVVHGLNPHDSTGVHGGYGDPDSDGEDNHTESVSGHNPHDDPPNADDIDGDGMDDTTESGRAAVIGIRDHPAPHLNFTLTY